MKPSFERKVHYALYTRPHLQPVFSDVSNIAGRLREHDENLFVVFNTMVQGFEVHCLGHLDDTYALSVPFNELDSRTIDLVKRCDIRNGYDPLKEIDEYNDRVDKEQEKDRYNHFESAVRYYHSKIRNEIDGMNTKTVF